MREADHPPTDILDLNIRWKPWPHEPRQAEADKLGAQTHLLKPPERGQQVSRRAWRGI
jgi:hypothetical protein